MDANNYTQTEFKDLLRQIECPGCLEFMCGKINLCRNGHSVCNNCRKVLRQCPLCRGLFSTMRNYAMESLVEFMSYPCKYAAQGCDKYIQKNIMGKHELECTFRTYSCMLKCADGEKCTWTGSRIDLQTHALTEHRNLVLRQEYKLEDWKISTEPNADTQMMLAFDELFLITRKVHNQVIYWSLNLVGTEAKCEMFSLNIQFGYEGGDKIIEWKGRTYSVDSPVNSLILDSKCIGLPWDIIQRLAIENYGKPFLWHKVEIIKKGDVKIETD